MFARLVVRRSLHTTSRLFAATPSPIEVSLRNALKESMKSKNRPALTCLKAILADVTNVAKAGANPSEPTTQENVVNVIRKGIAQRAQAAESYAPSSPAAHEESYSSLNKEIELLQSFLPTAPSQEVVQAAIDKVIAALPEDVRSSKSATGKVLAGLWEELGEAKAALDKKEVGKWVQETLKKL
ncbi:hypothetical protein IAT38_005714 [Cryptococcus sp. DSM 104549]